MCDFYFNKSEAELTAIALTKLQPLQQLLDSEPLTIYKVPIKYAKRTRIHDENFIWPIVKSYWHLETEDIQSITRWSATAFGGHDVMYFFAVQLRPDVEVPE